MSQTLSNPPIHDAQSDANPTTMQQTRLRFEEFLGIPFTSGNRVERLRNGDEIFPAMLEAIEAAEHCVELLTFVYWQGDIAVKFAETLAAKAREGVRVRVLLDAIGAHPMRRELVNLMLSAGVEVEWFRPVRTWYLWYLDRRTHRKVLVCDRRVGFTGGVGIADEWTGDARQPSDWRDTHFRITGPAVAGLRAAFFENWAEARQPERVQFDEVQSHDTSGETSIQLIRASSSIDWGDAATTLHLLIDSAEHSIMIATAYFVPDETLIVRLAAARERGVDITLMVPGEHMDVRMCRLGGQAEYKRLLELGVDIYEYNRSMLHAKLVMIDGAVSAIGSANMDCRSMYLNDELILVCLDEPLTQQLEADFTKDLEAAAKIDLSNWKRRGAWQRIKESAVRRIRYRL